MGVLSGYKIIEFAGIGPAPMCAMLLSDMGAEILRLDRAEDASLGIKTESSTPARSRPPLGGHRSERAARATEVALSWSTEPTG